MNMQELALEEAALKTLADTVMDRLKAVKAEMQEALTSGGVGKVDATLPDGTKVAVISRTDSKPAAVLVDPEAFLAWVRANRPSEVTTRLVTEVRPAYTTALLAEMTAAGTAEVSDRETGVVDAVPGVEIRATRSTTHSVRPTKDGRDRIAEAWRTGALGHLNLPQIAAKGGSPSPADDELSARLARLEERDALLTAMEAAGVDNWQGMDLVPELLAQNEEA
ncbi:hypothetical protein [Streptomyces sp. MCL20-2]|uniref:hypothetical protein n=1 Tax=Streptomyces sp. MCL20-2 TaxID=2967219 RepID=UPI0029666E9F|nr:hypothetical protein [Streptomyces sp. MCL20-2]